MIMYKNESKNKIGMNIIEVFFVFLDLFNTLRNDRMGSSNMKKEKNGQAKSL